eukprot:g46568.t1
MENGVPDRPRTGDESETRPVQDVSQGQSLEWEQTKPGPTWEEREQSECGPSPGNKSWAGARSGSRPSVGRAGGQVVGRSPELVSIVNN